MSDVKRYVVVGDLIEATEPAPDNVVLWEDHAKEVRLLRHWVDDLQSGMYINCVYCGHRYGPDDEVAPTMQQALYEHISVCPQHPLSKANAEKDEAERLLRLTCAQVFGLDTGNQSLEFLKRKQSQELADIAIALGIKADSLMRESEQITKMLDTHGITSIVNDTGVDRAMTLFERVELLLILAKRG